MRFITGFVTIRIKGGVDMNKKVDYWGGVCTALLAIGTACFSLICVKSHNAVCFSLAITFGTFTYHTAMRYAMGWIIGRHRPRLQRLLRCR